MNQILTTLSLYSELIACIFAASMLGLVVGWMLSSSSVKKRIDTAVKIRDERYKSLEESSAADTENLEEQLQEIAGELHSLKAKNRVLTDTIKKHDAIIQTERAEAIELNRQHAELQERLQRVIQQKELAGLAGRTSNFSASLATSGSTYTALSGASATSDSQPVVFSNESDNTLEATLPEYMDSAFSSDTHAAAMTLEDADLNTADTIAIMPSDLLDATIQMSAGEFLHRSKKNSETADSDFDDFIEETADFSGMRFEEMEESTVALDEESLDFAKRPYSISNTD